MSRQRVLGLLDQVISSASNFLGVTFAARSLSFRGLGVYAILYSCMNIAIGLSRAFCVDPLVVRHSALPREEQRRASRTSASAALLFGLMCSAAGLAVVPFVSGGTRSALCIVVVACPLILVQDALRFAWVMRNEVSKALVSDLVWLALLCLSVRFALFGGVSVTTRLASWVLSGAIAGLLGLGFERWRPDRHVLAWFVKHRDISLPQALQMAAGLGTGYFFVPTISILAGVAQAGVFRLGQTANSPYSVVAQGVGMVWMPSLVRASHDGQRALRSAAIRMSAFLGVIAVLVLLGIVFVPDSLATGVFGDGWSQASTTASLLAFQAVPVALAAGAVAGLLASGRAWASLRTRLALSGVYWTAGFSGAAIGGSSGASLGLCVATAVALPVWWKSFLADSPAQVHQ